MFFTYVKAGHIYIYMYVRTNDGGRRGWYICMIHQLRLCIRLFMVKREVRYGWASGRAWFGHV